METVFSSSYEYLLSSCIYIYIFFLFLASQTQICKVMQQELVLYLNQ